MKYGCVSASAADNRFAGSNWRRRSSKSMAADHMSHVRHPNASEARTLRGRFRDDVWPRHFRVPGVLLHDGIRL